MLSPLEPCIALDQVQRLNPLDYPGWDDLLATHPDSTFFQSTAWAKVLQKNYGFSPSYFVVLREDRLLALFPVMEVNSPLTGRRGVALPFTDSCVPLDHDSLIQKVAIPDVMGFGRERGWKYLECRGGKNFFGNVPAFQTFFTHELKLFRDEQYLFARFESSTRRAIRKVEKLGVSIQLSQTLESVREYYSLHCKTRKRHGLPPQSFGFFRNVHEQVLSAKRGMVVLARRGHDLIAGAIFFHFGDQAIYKFGASNEAFQDLRGNNLVMWSAIKWYAGKGLKTLNFGRTSVTNEGLRRFKCGWGAEERTSEYVRYDFRHNRYVIGKDGASGWHNHVFRLLPLFASRLLGSLLYRHVA